jgi:hypothetical protein
MSRDDEASWQDQRSHDGAPEQPADTSDEFGADPWGDAVADAFADPDATNLFSAEIENVNASDWNLDAALIWGDDEQDPVVEDGGIGLDFSM